MQKYKPYKKSFDYSYSIGIFPTLELLYRQPLQIETVIVAPNSKHSAGVRKILALCEQYDIPLCVSDKLISRLARDEHHFALGVFKKYSTSLEPNQPHVLLVQPNDTGNVGTIMRTMLGFEHTNLAIIKPAVDIFDPRTVRASMGAVFKQRVTYFNTLEEYMSVFKHHLYPFMLEADIILSKTRFSDPYCLVFGNEGAGLPTTWSRIGTPVRIAQSNQVDSLNMAVAASVALHHAYTQE